MSVLKLDKILVALKPTFNRNVNSSTLTVDRTAIAMKTTFLKSNSWWKA